MHSKSKSQFDKLERVSDEALYETNFSDLFKKNKNKFVYKDIREKIYNLRSKAFKHCKGKIIILGPKPESKELGAKIRIFLKEELNAYIESEYGADTDIRACFPEDVSNNVDKFDLNDEYNIFWDIDTKLIFVIWSKDARTIDTEFAVAARKPIGARKFIVFVEKKLWDENYFNMQSGELKYLKETFHTVYFVDFKKKKHIILIAKKIFNKHHKWAAKHDGIWPNDP